MDFDSWYPFDFIISLYILLFTKSVEVTVIPYPKNKDLFSIHVIQS